MQCNIVILQNISILLLSGIQSSDASYVFYMYCVIHLELQSNLFTEKVIVLLQTVCELLTFTEILHESISSNTFCGEVVL